MALNGIYLASSAIGIGTFLANLFGEPDGSATTVRIGAAIGPPTGPSASDGSLSQIRTLDQNSQILGLTEGDTYIPTNGYTDARISQPNQGQAQFVEIHAGTDAVCVAYVATTWQDGSKWMWVGDWGNACGLKWYYSGVTATTEESGKGHQPFCTWFDSDGTVTGGDGDQAGSIRIGVSEYGANSNLNGQPGDAVCHQPQLTAWFNNDGTNPIFEKRDGSDLKMNKKRASKRKIDRRAVISKYESHNATYLCEHANSQGPDLISMHERKHCDMETRELSDLCDDKKKTSCFDVKSMAYVHENNKRSIKSYLDVMSWDPETEHKRV